jgi:hypothetical protein
MAPTASSLQRSNREQAARPLAKRSLRQVSRGHIVLVQEGRFRLVTDDGQGLLLTLAHNANVDAQDLHRFQRERTSLEVHFTGEPNLVSGVAHDIREMNDE